MPLLIVPPTINKYYALDLAPDRSLVEFLVREGQQVFVMSWRNPDARHAHWGLRHLRQAILDALDAVERISRSGPHGARPASARAASSPAIAAAYLAATGRQDRLAAFALAVTVHRQRAGRHGIGALGDQRLAAAAKAASRRRGYLDGRSLAEVFAWLRPGDLIWNYWVNNYLLGKKPPAFDILFWNADTTRMTAGLHADFVDLAMDNQLVDRAARSPCSACRSTCPTSTPTPTSWPASPTTSRRGRTATAPRSCSAASTRFVLSTSGHIAALVNPPGNPKASYQVNKDNPADPAEWLTTAETRAGHLVDRLRRLGWPSAAARPSRRRNSSAAAAFARSSRRPAPTSSTAEGEDHASLYETIGRSRGTDFFRIADQLTAEERDYWRRTARFRRRRGAAGHQRLLGAGRISVAA